MPDVEGGAAASESDALLMRRTAAGDRDAFAALYRRHHASVYRFACLMTGSDGAAEDVVQEVFLTLMKDAGRFDPERAALTTYLFGIARHYTRRRLVRERRFVGIESAMATPGGADTAAELDRASDLQRLRAAILSLPSRYREVIVLCDLEGVTYESAAATVRCAVGTIRSRLHRARQLLTVKMRRERAPAASRAVMRCAV